MGKSKDTQIKKPTRATSLAGVPRSRAPSQSQTFTSKLVSDIAQLHFEVMSINLLSELREWKLGCHLLALKELSGHGYFRTQFEPTLGHVMGLRQAQRYMARKKRIDSYMPVFRSRLCVLKPDSDIESLSDEEVLKSLPPEELRSILDNGKPKAVPTLLPPITQGLTADFTDALATLFTQIDCLLSPEPIEVDSTLVQEVRSGANPLEGLSVWPPRVFAVAGLHKQSPKWISDLITLAIRANGSETLIAIPVNALQQGYKLFDFPNVLISSARLLNVPSKHLPSHFIVTFIARSERNPGFIEAFAQFGTVKVPATV